MAKLKDGFFVGDAASSQDFEFGQSNKIQYMINCAGLQLPNIWSEYGVQYLTFKWRDEEDFNLFDMNQEEDPNYEYFNTRNNPTHSFVVQQIVGFIDEALQKGVSVLIHSLKGTGRCVACAMVYFMAKYGWGNDKALAFLEAKRVGSALNLGFRTQLKSLDYRLQFLRSARYSQLPTQQRQAALEAAHVRLVEWKVVTHPDSDASDDILSSASSDDERLLVNSYINSLSDMDALTFESTRHGSNVEHVATKLRWIDEATNHAVQVANHTVGAQDRDWHRVSWRRVNTPPNIPPSTILKRDSSKSDGTHEWMTRHRSSGHLPSSAPQDQVQSMNRHRRNSPPLAKGDAGDVSMRTRSHVRRQGDEEPTSFAARVPHLAWDSNRRDSANESHSSSSVRLPKHSTSKSASSSHSTRISPGKAKCGASSIRTPRPSSADSAYGRHRKPVHASNQSRSMRTSCTLDISQKPHEWDTWPSPDLIVCGTKRAGNKDTQRYFNQTMREHRQSERHTVGTNQSKRWAQPSRVYDAATVYGTAPSSRPKSSNGLGKTTRSHGRNYKKFIRLLGLPGDALVEGHWELWPPQYDNIPQAGTQVGAHATVSG